MKCEVNMKDELIKNVSSESITAIVTPMAIRRYSRRQPDCSTAGFAEKLYSLNHTVESIEKGRRNKIISVEDCLFFNFFDECLSPPEDLSFMLDSTTWEALRSFRRVETIRAANRPTSPSQEVLRLTFDVMIVITLALQENDIEK
ncbi:hypothetical protein DICVIV_00409 [Dictyocaulus viviparus]|uniref:Uncharacterized protein n=1 Tax=Dictyocaulus viviparus TaxID=29172 RepID=A0A0D8YFP6_DICVI|nr:hypothetical protein DICVIV_00409 [Dictyocaulus viviparus]